MVPESCIDSAARSPNEWPAYRLLQNADNTVTETLVTAAGLPYEIPDGATVEFVVTERAGDAEAFIQEDATINEDGSVEVQISALSAPYPGVWLAEWRVLNESGTIIHRNLGYVEFEGDLLDETTFANRPLSVAEIRLAMRDKSPTDNFLLDAVQFTDTEIAWAVRRCVDEWNETFPRIETYTPATFPYRYHWLNGTIGELYRIAGQHARRNDLSTSSAGLTVTEATAEDWMKLADYFHDMWYKWMRNTKKALNVNSMWGSVYGYPPLRTRF